MFFCSETHAQSSVEAAFIIPVCMLVLICLLQPLCLMYTQAIMWSAANQALRCMETTQDESSVKSYIHRRLSAIPEAPLFHVGGEGDWDISCSGFSEKTAEITISGHAKPLPLFYAASRLFAKVDNQGIVLTIKAHSQVRPDWLGGDYESWVEMWDQ
ncbi:pilus assembly protein [Atopobium fossor]|uniref:pilus assembly protein n=1 Tax=Atopobium fossor TaxID=39487 RepID=UPI0004042E4C|nr:pilus assembly protein [Atopobium fossor]